ncbi:acyl-CoA Delta-9 desaturase-like [Diprion similis]|uniref:acyl-CoA Delta-9 desaturase-like n=1 Tax=Diprion similis TaxID=362088 RepID=UPI001EF75EA3|nr:acyl-CoA Delta-9 desaturase-like [Diprion similis]
MFCTSALFPDVLVELVEDTTHSIPISSFSGTNYISLNSYLKDLQVNFIRNHRVSYHSWDTLIKPADNFLEALLTAGKASHNHHHTAPWDYKASEWPFLRLNITTLFVDLFAKIGWAYDLREPSPTLVQNVIQKIGRNSNI